MSFVLSFCNSFSLKWIIRVVVVFVVFRLFSIILRVVYICGYGWCFGRSWIRVVRCWIVVSLMLLVIRLVVWVVIGLIWNWLR